MTASGRGAYGVPAGFVAAVSVALVLSGSLGLALPGTSGGTGLVPGFGAVRDGSPPPPSSGGGPAWTNVTNLSPTRPPCASDIGLAYDAALAEFVGFGGVNGCGTMYAGTGFDGNATWTWVNGTWANVSASLPTSPSPRYGMAMAWDPQANAIVAFGGAGPTGTTYGDTWLFNGSWSNVTGNQTHSPGAAFQAEMAYDPTLDGVVLVDGGSIACGCNLNQTWAFRSGQWTNVTATVLPPAVHSAMLWYDAASSDLLLYGGVTDVGTISGETWSYASLAWTQLRPATAPPPEFDGAAVYDPALGEPLLFGGYTAPVPTYAPVGGTWAFSTGNWTNLSATILGAPSARGGARAAFDPALNVTLLYGGRLAVGLVLGNDTWELSAGYVSLVRAALAAAPDPVLRDENVTFTTTATGGSLPYSYVYGGLPPGCSTANVSSFVCAPASPGTFLVSVNVSDPSGAFALASANLTVAQPANADWFNLTMPDAAAPPCASDVALAYDSALSEFVLFGGVTGCGSGATGVDGNETWTYANGTWTNLTGSLPTAPSARYGMAAAYDAAIGAIVAFGGAGPYGGTYSDTWIFNGTWSELTNLTTSPGGVFQADAVYDASLGAVLLVDGGYSGYSNQNATWEFVNWTWTNLSLTVLPPAVHSATAWYDPSNASVLLFGGVTDLGGLSNETWVYQNGSWSERFPASSPPPTYDGAAVYADGPVLFGGYGAPVPIFGPLSGTWAFANGTWTNVSAGLAGGPSPRGGARAAYDPVQNWTLLYGGRLASALDLANDTWGYPNVPLMGSVAILPTELDLGGRLDLVVSAVGGDRPYTYRYSGLPAGCTPANVSLVSCIPTQNGTYRVSVEVVDPLGATFSAHATVIVFPRLTISLNLSAREVDADQNVTFTASPSGGAGSDLVYYTGLPAGCASTDVLVLVCAPTDAGTYSVSAEVTDRLGVSAASPPENLTVRPVLNVTLEVAPTEIDLGETVTYTVGVTGGLPGYSASYESLPAGCSPSTALSVTCQPDEPGTYSTAAEVTDALGVTATSLPIELSVQPALEVSLPSPLPPLEEGVVATFNATSTGGTGPVTFSWSGLPPGCSASGASVVCNATAVGPYPITVSAVDATFALTSADGTLRVVPALSARLAASRSVVDVGVGFGLNASTTGGGGPVGVVWNLSASFDCAPDATGVRCVPTLPGNQSASIVATDALGGRAFASLVLSVAPPLSAGAIATAVRSCAAPYEVRLVGAPAGGVTPYVALWSFGDGTTAPATAGTISHNYTSAGTFDVVYTVTDAGGGSFNATTSVTVGPDAALCPSSGPAGTSAFGTADLLWVALAAAILAVALGVLLARRRRPRPRAGPSEARPLPGPAPGTDEPAGSDDRIYGNPPP